MQAPLLSPLEPKHSPIALVRRSYRRLLLFPRGALVLFSVFLYYLRRAWRRVVA